MAGSTYSDRSRLNLSEERLVELTDTPEAPGIVNDEVVEDTSLDAQAEIDDRLGPTYPVPFTAPIPGPIERIHSKIWKRMLFERRDSMQVPASVEADYQKALADLEDYATPGDGGRVLVGAQMHSARGSSPAAGSFSSDAESNEPARRVFGRFRDRLG
jgi:phage gp36-like protein